MLYLKAAQIDKLLAEVEMREKKRRLKWFEKNYTKVFLSTSMPPDKVPSKAHELYKEVVKFHKQTIRMEKQFKADTAEDRRKMAEGLTKPVTPKWTRDELFKPVMIPAKPETRHLIYTGCSKNGDGPYSYLKERYKLSPEEKFQEKVLTSHVYGWKIKERRRPVNKKFARVTVIQPSFYRRCGIWESEDELRMRPIFTSGHFAVETL